MSKQQAHKPGVEEWLHLAEVTLDRLTDCIHIYKKPPHIDVFMPDAERQHKTGLTLKLLHRIHALVDKAETPSDFVPDVHPHDEQMITGLALLFGETLELLPVLSTDMQKLLKSAWQAKFPNKTAQKLFYGVNDESEGIGSGHPEHGRLPEALFNMIEREQIGDIRHPREALLKQAEPRRNDGAARERWAQRNGRYLRTAGRVE